MQVNQDLQQTVAQDLERLDTLALELQQQRNSHQLLQGRTGDLAAQLQKAQDQLDQLRSENSQMTVDLEQKVHRILALEEAVEGLRQENQLMQTKMLKVKEAALVLQQKAKTLQQAREELRRRILKLQSQRVLSSSTPDR
ncbi:MAG: hypothetical protein HC921_14450 [Synechococcaceae cyanobacterium SM2_3_1]|nr:hypothetical protein [Synechococcaceae cyanobacterium SM2_3_1]